MSDYTTDLLVSESTRQADHKKAVTLADHNKADADHRARLLTASAKWGIRNGAFAAIVANGDAYPAGSFPSGVA